jgi:MoaA/NifB/PqqE/SkfB family radical SAM enzyme
MTTDDWVSVLDQAAELHTGLVQFIGGEPTLHPALPDLITHARALQLEVEVFSNLGYVSSALWTAFTQSGVRLATSYYSPVASDHEAITGRAGSHARTRDNIVQALERGIPLRVGIIGVLEGQQVEEAEAELKALGVTEVRVDWLRQVGRGVRDGEVGVEQLCGNCASGSLAISPDGEVWPCVFSRWIRLGNVRQQPLATIHTGPVAVAARADLASTFTARATRSLTRHQGDPAFLPACLPDDCIPSGCIPASCIPANCVPQPLTQDKRTQLAGPSAHVSHEPLLLSQRTS